MPRRSNKYRTRHMTADDDYGAPVKHGLRRKAPNTQPPQAPPAHTTRSGSAVNKTKRKRSHGIR